MSLGINCIHIQPRRWMSGSFSQAAAGVLLTFAVVAQRLSDFFRFSRLIYHQQVSLEPSSHPFGSCRSNDCSHSTVRTQRLFRNNGWRTFTTETGYELVRLLFCVEARIWLSSRKHFRSMPYAEERCSRCPGLSSTICS